MKTKFIVMLILITLIFSGCNVINTLTRKTPQSEIDEAMKPFYEKQAEQEQKKVRDKEQKRIMAEKFMDSVPICDGEVDCNAQWEAAQAWVAKNCGMKIQTVTNVLIQTYSTPAPGIGHSTDLSATIIKEPLGDGKYKINASIGCSNPLGCYPDAFEATQNFNDYVNNFKTIKNKKSVNYSSNSDAAGILDMLKKLNPTGFSRASDETKNRAVKCVKDGYQNCEVILNQ